MLSQEELNQLRGLKKLPSHISKAILKDPNVKIPKELSSTAEYIYQLVYSIKETPKCKCGAKCKFLSFGQGYAETCKQKNCKYNLQLASQRYKENFLKKYGVENASQLKSVKEKKQNTLLRNYGVTSPLKNKDILKKSKNTLLKNYGVTSPAQSEEIKEKIKQTNLERYGREYILQLKDVRSKSKTTCLERYGVEFPTQSQEVKNKVKSTFKEKFGVDAYIASKECREHAKQIARKRYGVDYFMQAEEIKQKAATTSLEKYGTLIPSQSEAVKEKIRQTNLKKYGVENASQSEEIRNKVNRTRLNNVYDKWVELCKQELVEVEPCFSKEAFKGTSGKYAYKWRCKKCGNIFEFNMVNGVPVCRKCHPKSISKEQQEIIDFLINDLNYSSDQIKINDRKIITPLEIDILVDDKVGIEYNGAYWHSTTSMDDTKRHIKKLEAAEEKGIKLINIFSWDWYNHKEIVKSRLRAALGRNITKIFARKCQLRALSSKEVNLFLTENHLQGRCACSKSYGLFHEEELVSVMTFGKPRFNTNCDWELIRFANKLNCSVIGGASRLLKQFIKDCAPKQIISYANRCWSKGELYEKLGFVLALKSPPNYVYVKNDEILTRYQCQKHKLLKKYLEIDKSKTEGEIMKEKGYVRVYDCGNLVYTLDLS